MKLVDKFCEIACSVSGKDINNIEKRVCPDILVGYDNKFYFSKKERMKVSGIELSTDTYNQYTTIVIVLESPHIDEYSSDKKFCPTPAIGKTGTNLQKYFNQEKIFENIEIIGENKNYRVILMNVIQYQCSLGVSTKIYRDAIFDGLLKDDDIISNFVNRLKSYNPDVVFNGCTKGANNLRRKNVTQIILNNVKEVELFEMNHPCSWNRRNDGSFRNVIKIL